MLLPKIWLMRQAGRYLPEYRKLRESCKNFLDLCYDPLKASQVTLQPLERFNLDAAIVFSDILVTLDSLGIKTEFQKGIGPVLEVISNTKRAEEITVTPNNEKFNKVAETIKLVKKQLPNKNIIGFIGGSWTICAYTLEGKGKTEFQEASKKIYTNFDLVKILIDKVTKQNIFYLKEQIKAGASIVQIFESHAGKVPPEFTEELIIKPTNIICKAIKEEFPDIKIIGFPRGSGYFYDKFIEETEVDIIGCDQYIPLDRIKKWQEKKYVQGNLNPLVLLSNLDNIKRSVDNILNTLDTSKLIFNLGHGILPETPIENVKFLVDYVNSCLK